MKKYLFIGFILLSTIAPAWGITTYTTEPCIGGNGVEIASAGTYIDGGAARRYACQTSIFGGFGQFLTDIYNLTFFVTLICSVLMLVAAGIAVSVSGLSEGAKTSAKNLIWRVVIGIILLAFIPFILKTLAPFVFV